MIQDAMAPISTVKIAVWVKETHVREITGCIVLCFMSLQQRTAQFMHMKTRERPILAHDKLLRVMERY